MSDFKLCENGHYFPKGLEACPYCPKTGGGGQAKTSLSDLEKQFLKQDKPPLGGSNIGGMGTMGNLGSTQIFDNPSEKLDRTKIYGNDVPFMIGGGNSPAQFQPQPPSQGRKLAGWLVSFTIDPLGADYKLYEGRNLIGADPGCDIVIRNDAAVSGRHLTILYRMGTFKFRDELSTNGTFVNDVFEEEGNLKDGDMIKIGDTLFKFRSIA